MAALAPRALALGEERVLEWRGRLHFGWFSSYASDSTWFKVEWDPDRTHLLSARLVWRARRGAVPTATAFRVRLDGRLVGSGGWPVWSSGEISGEADVTGLLTPGTHHVSVEAVGAPTWPYNVEFEVAIYVRYEGERPEHEQEEPPSRRALDLVKWALVLGGVAVGALAAERIARAVRGRG